MSHKSLNYSRILLCTSDGHFKPNLIDVTILYLMTNVIKMDKLSVSIIVVN